VITLTPTAPTTLTPGSSIPFNISYLVTGNETVCDIRPIATVQSDQIGGISGTDVPYNGTTVVPQILLQPLVNSSTYLSPSTGTNVTLGTTVTTTTTFTNRGCIAGSFNVSPSKSGDTVSLTSPTGTFPVSLSPNTSAIFTGSHTVVSTDGASFALSYTITGSAVVGNQTVNAPSGRTPDLQYTVSGAATTGTPGSGTLTITKTASIQSASAGQSFAFTITVTNSSAVPFANVVVSDTVPTETMTVTSVAGTTGVAATNSGNQITAAIASLGAGQTASITVNVTVLRTVRAPTTLSNTASVTYTGGTPLTASVTVPIGTGAAVLPTTGYGTDPREMQVLLFTLGGALVIAFFSFGYLMMGRTRRQ